MLADSLRLLVRGWRITVLGCLVAALAGTAAFLVTPAQQKSQAQVLFVPPNRTVGIDGDTNPLLGLGPALSIAADIVRVTISDQDTARALTAVGATSSYTITPNYAENGGPILFVTAKDTDGARAQATVAAVVARTQAKLMSLQESYGAPRAQWISAQLLTRTPVAVPVYKAQVRSGIVASLALLVLTWLLLALREGRRRGGPARRTRRPLAARSAPPEDDPHAELLASGVPMNASRGA